MVDIKLDTKWALTQAANGDAPIIKQTDCLLQDIKLEAITQEGELFYDITYGWSMLQFIQSEDTDLTRIEIDERIKSKLSKRIEVDTQSIATSINFKDDILMIGILFKLLNDDKVYNIDIVLDRIRVEVKDDK